MTELFERYTIEITDLGARITFDQRRNALVNFLCGLVVAILGYLWDEPMGNVVLWIGIVWGLLAARAYTHERVTELGDVLTYQNGKKHRSMGKSDITELVLRLERRPRRSRKKSVLPWTLEIRGDRKRPFASYSFQEEQPARAFAGRVADILSVPLTERVEREREPVGAYSA